MLGLWSRYLRCFYCNTRSDTRFEGEEQQFVCKHCESPNYYDKNGEITDPPVATQDEPVAPLLNLSQTEPSSQSRFCQTCVKNQRLVVSSLAQFHGDDVDDDFELDDEYYRFREGLEERYPQVCADCMVFVQDGIRSADYIAKSDHLGKMMAQSRKNLRRVQPRRTGLDWLHLTVRVIWWGALALQMLWHVRGLAELLGRSESGLSDPDDRSVWRSAVDGTRQAASFLPEEDGLIQASIVATVASVWWNPKFVQVSRGFTKQLSGFRQWYSFQALICAMRVALPLLDVRDQSRDAQLSAHVAVAGLALLITAVAARCIKTDTTPLFAPRYGSASPTQATPVRRQRNKPRSLAEELGDVLPRGREIGYRAPVSGHRAYDSHFTPPNRPASSHNSGDEMEWTPTSPQSLPRALKASPAGRPQAFGHAPTSENSGPFYFKTPPAPTNPARRIRNPPNQPVIWSSADGKRNHSNNSIRFGRGAQPTGGMENGSKRSTVEFSKGNFFAPRKEDAEDESLANLLGRGISLEDEKTPKKGWFSWG